MCGNFSIGLQGRPRKESWRELRTMQLLSVLKIKIVKRQLLSDTKRLPAASRTCFATFTTLKTTRQNPDLQVNTLQRKKVAARAIQPVVVVHLWRIPYRLSYCSDDRAHRAPQHSGKPEGVVIIPYHMLFHRGFLCRSLYCFHLATKMRC